MDDKRAMLRHFLGALAYRTQKALRDAPPGFAEFQAGNDVRPPREIVRHMTSVLGYARTFFVGGDYRPERLPDMDAEIGRFHEMLDDLARHISEGTPYTGITAERMLQGPFADAMTHAGQLALLRRLAQSPIRPENFIYAEISPDRLGADQPLPARPDEEWPEQPRRGG